MANKQAPEDCDPPTIAVVNKVRSHVSQKWPDLHVTVLWVWVGGQKRLHFRWDDKTGKHRRVPRLATDDQRIMCVMSYSSLITSIEILKG